MFRKIAADVRVVFDRDPAVRSRLEALICYPHIKSLWFHRIAHQLWKGKLHLPARILSQLSRFLTGIEIHPGATISTGLFIDHGAGGVIGETSEIGDDVTMYQGVVLGGTSHEKKKRHPTLEDGVIVGAGAVLLGPIRVSFGARVGAGSVVIRSVRAGGTVVGVPGHDVHERRRRATALQHGDLPDPVAQAVGSLQAELNELKARIACLDGGEDQVLVSPGSDLDFMSEIVQHGAGI